MGKKVAGTCYIKVDGAQLEVSGGVECPLAPFKRESVVPGFYKEEELVPYTKLEAVLTPDFPREKIINGTDMTITTEMANGGTYVLTGAYLVDEPTHKGDDGKTELQFDGKKGYWQ